MDEDIGGFPSSEDSATQLLPMSRPAMRAIVRTYNGLHGKASDEASGVQASGLGAIALFPCNLPSVLSVACIGRDERDDLLPPAYRPAHVRGCAFTGNLPHHYRLPEGPPAILARSHPQPERSLGWRTYLCSSCGAKSRSFLPASTSTLFLIPVA